MKSKFLTITGIIQILIALLHISIIFGITRAPELAADAKITLHLLNAAVLTTVFYFAWVSFFQRAEMLGTKFGRGLAWFIAIFYLQRGIVELFIRGFNPAMFGLAVVIAAMYIVIALPAKSDPAV